jgi:hypothetical protein
VRASLNLAEAVAELKRLRPNGEAARALLDHLEAAAAGDALALRRALKLTRRGPSDACRRRLAQRDDVLRVAKREHYGDADASVASRAMAHDWLTYANSSAGRLDSRAVCPYPPSHGRAAWWRMRQLGCRPLAAERIRKIIMGKNDVPFVDHEAA